MNTKKYLKYNQNLFLFQTDIDIGYLRFLRNIQKNFQY